VTARIGEGQVGKLSVGLRAKVRVAGIAKPIGATITKISVLADSSQRWFNPDLKEYPVDLVLDETPKSLKPGMGANVEILVNHLDNVLAVPLAAIYSAGPDTYVFVREGDRVKPVVVKVGQSNDTHAQIRDGIEAGAEVMLLQAGQGRDLLQQNGIKVEGPTTRGSEDGFGQQRHSRNHTGADAARPDAPRPDATPRPDAARPDATPRPDAARPDAPPRPDAAPRSDSSAPPDAAPANGSTAADATASDRHHTDTPTTAPFTP